MKTYSMIVVDEAENEILAGLLEIPDEILETEIVNSDKFLDFLIEKNYLAYYSEDVTYKFFDDGNYFEVRDERGCFLKGLSIN